MPCLRATRRMSRTVGERLAIDQAVELARTLGHAAVVARRGQSISAPLSAFDSWRPLEEGWVAIAFVSSTGKVVAKASEE